MSVTTPAGFRASGVAAGLKTSGGPDVALVVNDGPDHHAAAVFTTNRVLAAPVTWSSQVVADHRVDAVVLNSGGANACTGTQGLADARTTAEHVGQRLGIRAEDVAVCSTGLIGELLPMDRLLTGVDAAAEQLALDGGNDAAEAILTTDTVSKQAHSGGAGWSVGGMAKGAGMLAPSLATMLVVLSTDAVVDADDLATALKSSCALTFDRVDSDGCMSTNDTVVVLASGASGVKVERADLTASMTQVCAELARALIGDAEGAHHDIEIEVVGAAQESDALEVARAVAGNNLFKCAVFGGDPNWGRILAAIGTTQAQFDPNNLDVSINGVRVCRATALGEDRNLVDLSPRHVHVLIDLHAGPACSTVWTNDLTHEYVHENSAYSS